MDLALQDLSIQATNQTESHSHAERRLMCHVEEATIIYWYNDDDDDVTTTLLHRP
jgi:hypothetical protein